MCGNRLGHTWRGRHAGHGRGQPSGGRRACGQVRVRALEVGLDRVQQILRQPARNTQRWRSRTLTDGGDSKAAFGAARGNADVMHPKSLQKLM